MTIEFKEDMLLCTGVLTVEDAELLLHEVAGRPQALVDLGGCEHLHSACLQVLMAASARVARWPESPALAAWLRAALPQDELQHA